jgi:hypothetical protein
VKFKDLKLQDELYHTPTLLQVMAEWLDQLSIGHFGKEIEITRVFEKVNGSSGVHEAHRAFDARDEHAGGHYYKPEEIAFLVSEMNRRFPRTDGKQSCIHHSFHGGPHHLHVQVGVPGVTEDLDCGKISEGSKV